MSYYPVEVTTANGPGLLIARTKDGRYLVRHPEPKSFDPKRCDKVLVDKTASFGPLAIYKELEDL